MNEFVIKNGFISQGTSYVSDGNLGVGVTSPTSRLEVKGVDSSSSNYGLKVQNSGGTDNLVVRNDSTVVIGDSSEYQGGSFYYTRNNGYDNKFYMNPNLGNGNNSLNYFDLNVGWIRQGQNNGSGFGLTTVKNELTIFDDFGVLRLNKDTYNGYTGNNNLEVSFREGTGSFLSGSMGSFAYNRTLSFNDIYDREIRGIKIDTSLGTFSNSGSGVSTNIGLDVKVGNGDINYSALFNGGNVGIGATSPTAKLEVKSNSSTGDTMYPFSVTNYPGSNVLYLSNQNYYVDPNNLGVYSYIYDNQFNIELAGSSSQFKLNRGVNKFWMNPYPNVVGINLLVESTIGGGGGAEAGIRHVFTSTSGGGTIYGESLYVGTDSSTGTTTIVGNFIGKQGFTNPNATFYPLIVLDGNVGIGTSTPTNGKLEVVGGSSQGVIATSTNDIAVNGTSTGASSFGIKGESDLGTSIRSNVTNTSAIGLEVNYTPTNSSLFKVLGDGNVGIGTSTPSEKLDVSGKTKTDSLQIYNPYIPTGSTDPTGSIGDISLSGDVLFWRDSTQWYRISGQTW